MRSPRQVWCADLGLLEFSKAHAIQLAILEARASGRVDRDMVLILEHPPVFTIGRRGNRDHLKVSSTFLTEAGMDLLHIERGGDITFHGPGQLILYPVFHLREAGFGIVEFVEKLEEIMIRTAEDMGVSASRDPRNHGIWAGGRKMGFVGIAVRRSISFHGIALNVDLPLEPFTWINPCGLENIHITSLNLEADRTIEMAVVKTNLLKQLEDVFTVSLQHITTDKLKDSIQSTRN